MRSSTVITLALAVAAVPTFAAPSSFYGPSYAKRHEVAARASTDDMLARSFASDFVDGFKKGFVGTLETVGPIVADFLKREELQARHEELARSFASDFVDGFKKGFVGTLETVGPIVADFLKRDGLTARDYPMDQAKREELARSFASDFVDGFKKGFVGTLETVGPIVADFLKREDLERLARESAVAHIHRGDMASRDFASDFVDGFKKGFTGTLKTLAPIALGFLKREDIDLLARQALATHMQRRDEMVSRDFLSDFVDGFKQGFVGTLQTIGPIAADFFHKATDERRDDMMERDFASDFVDGFKKGFTGTLETLAPIALGFLKRDDLELLTRAYP
ncbi:hypothetical protein PHLCEN_2v13691 [Hermanssonia centrifuga]|uniref:Uncharacterized protein n=1 Tax=Hermanssonia centrifuga TaxID=98765 RepID=A0A2R6NDK6_9APHY|nr:hypothetical protein PHLCEN_2v13691 [Hermanssonia centrifuga]